MHNSHSSLCYPNLGENPSISFQQGQYNKKEERPSYAHDYFWRGAKPFPLLAATVALACLVSLALPYLPPTAHLFSFTPLPVQELAIVVGLALVYVVVLDMVKVWFYRRADKDAPPLLDAPPSTQAEH